MTPNRSRARPAQQSDRSRARSLQNRCEVSAQYLLGAATDHVLELDGREQARIFNLGYYTWVEQRGVPVEAFDVRRAPSFWTTLHAQAAARDQMIVDFNQRTGVVHES